MRQGTCWSGGGALVVEATGNERQAALLDLVVGGDGGA